jgi:GTP cyclohydrolase II
MVREDVSTELAEDSKQGSVILEGLGENVLARILSEALGEDVLGTGPRSCDMVLKRLLELLEGYSTRIKLAACAVAIRHTNCLFFEM